MFGRKSSSKTVDNRRYPRFMSDRIRLELDGTELQVLDISATGVQVRGAPNWMIQGQGVNFRFIVPVRNETAIIPASGRVVRKLADTISLHYASPHPNWRRLLTQYLARPH